MGYQDTDYNILEISMMFLKRTNLLRFCQAKLRSSMPIRNGGFKTIDKVDIDKYILDILCKGETCKLPHMTRSVAAFKKAIENDPILKMCFTGALKAIPEGGILYNRPPNEVLRLMTAICLLPPSFANQRITGVPFYSLFVDFLNTRYGEAFFSNPLTNIHLKNIFNDYQIMLTSTISTENLTTDDETGWFSPRAEKRANYEEYVTPQQKNLPHWGFKNWNDWFTRSFLDIKKSRPVDPTPNGIVNSSDSYPLTYPKGSSGTNPTYNVQGENHFWLKDSKYSLHDMLGSAQMGIVDQVNDHFVGGTVYQAFLDPWCYHRWHSPISGKVKYSYKLGGTYYLDNPGLPLTGKENYIDSQPMLSVVSVRQIFIIELKEDPSRWVAVIEIGMAEVSGCHPTVVETQQLQKGDELGYFTFGGSSYALIFDKKFDLTFDPEIFKLKCTDLDTGKPAVCKQKVNSLLCTYK